jgi:hypothetical protein
VSLTGLRGEENMSVRRFLLVRLEDHSGVSGTGVVAEGVQFSTGKCIIAWISEYPSYALYDSIDVLEKIHGHDGRTKVHWMDDGDE